MNIGVPVIARGPAGAALAATIRETLPALLLPAVSPLAYTASKRVVVPAEHSRLLFSWTPAPLIGEVFVGGAASCSAAADVPWAAGCAAWAHARVVVSTIEVVATTLMGAALEHLGQSRRLFGVASIGS